MVTRVRVAVAQTLDHRSTVGHSLLDALLVSALVGAALAVSVPVSLQSIRWIQLRSATNELARELHRGRLQALTENEPVRVEVDTTRTGYRLVSASPGSPPRGAERTLAHGIVFSQVPGRPVVFHPSGAAAPAGSYVLSGPAGRVRVLVHLTGRIRMEDVVP